MLGQRLSSSRKRLGLSQRELAAEMGRGYDQTMISHVETGRSGLVGEGLSKAATALGVSIDYLFGLTDTPAPVSELVTHGSDPNPVAWIPKLAAVVGDGRGGEPYDTTIVDRVPFHRRRLTEREINPESCHFVTVQGDSMEPTLPDGCTVLVDTSRRVYQDDGILVMRYEQQVMEKVLRYLEPVRFKKVAGYWDGEPYSDFYFGSDKQGSGTWPVQLFDIKEVFGEVMWVERFL